MKSYILFFLLITSTFLFSQPKKSVIVELFTSQGCSSCPAADANLEQIKKWAENNNLPVYPLSFHVDYWNYLGWNDRFSSALATERQYKYASIFKTGKVYTPQMVINGKQELIGSRDTESRDFINEQLKSQDGVFEINSHYSLQNDSLLIYYKLSKMGADYLNIAIVEEHTQTAVSRGENSNRILSSVNVVRLFHQTKNIKKSGLIKLKNSLFLPSKKFKIIVYQQRMVNMAVLAATEAKFEY